MRNQHKQRGATALFIVIFSVLLMSTITMSFITLMVREQQRSTNDELSQSAYDSAMAGVEDAKRVIIKSRGSGVSAQAAKRAIEDSQTTAGCQEVGKNANGITQDVSEIPIQSSTSSTGQEMNQAYTCIEVSNLTDDYQTVVGDGTLVMVPLKMAAEIDRIVVSWQLPTDSSSDFMLHSQTTTPLYAKSAWNANNHPAMMRVQTITPNGSFSLDDFDSADTSSSAFLYPANFGASEDVTVSMPERSSTVQRPILTDCDTSSNTVLTNAYLCAASLSLQRPVAAGSSVSYLVLQTVYRGASVKIQGYNGDRLVQFDGAQPTVDSTGRANDLFRRVLARLSLGGDGEQGTTVTGPIPHFSLDVDGSICKNFFVTDNDSGGYSPECNP